MRLCSVIYLYIRVGVLDGLHTQVCIYITKAHTSTMHIHMCYTHGMSLYREWMDICAEPKLLFISLAYPRQARAQPRDMRSLGNGPTQPSTLSLSLSAQMSCTIYGTTLFSHPPPMRAARGVCGAYGVHVYGGRCGWVGVRCARSSPRAIAGSCAFCFVLYIFYTCIYIHAHDMYALPRVVRRCVSC